VKDHWRKLAARFDALAQRERIVVFVGALLGLVLLFYVLALDPLAARKKRLTLELADGHQRVATMEKLLVAQPGVVDPDAAKRVQRDSLRKQLAEVDKSMGQLQRGLVPPERTASLLEDMLGRSRLQLVSVRTLPVQRYVPGAGPGADAKGAKSDRVVYQHGFEIALQGSYADLQEYLTRLEQTPWRMFWGRISVSTEEYPTLTVTLTVQTLSLSKSWLIV
jgi:MSHA biogenesis protein MshJ